MDNKFQHVGSIKDFYKNASIFVTGGTGFLGQVLIEKILRTCDSVQCIYVLMRPKKGISSYDRHQQFVQKSVRFYL